MKLAGWFIDDEELSASTSQSFWERRQNEEEEGKRGTSGYPVNPGCYADVCERSRK
jgi:hypothetical protein